MKWLKNTAEVFGLAAIILVCGVLFSLVLSRISGQSINGIPNQSMSGFTNVAVSTMAIGGATPLNYAGVLSSSSTTPASIGASGCADTAFTFTGLAVGAQVTVPEPPSTQATNVVMAGVRVTGANTLSIRFCNISTLTTQTPVAGVYTIFAAW